MGLLLLNLSKILIKTVVEHWKTCIIYKRMTQTQIMAALSTFRTVFTRAFASTGVDFVGPFDIGNYTGRACLITQGCMRLFICFVTKAIRLEAVSKFSTSAFAP